jgi:hypothetical protein
MMSDNFRRYCTGDIKNRPSCPNCGKAAPRFTEKLGDTLRSEYTGNLQIIRDTARLNESNGGARIWGHLTLWDGETYGFQRGPFCTNACSMQWAQQLFYQLQKFKEAKDPSAPLESRVTRAVVSEEPW